MIRLAISWMLLGVLLGCAFILLIRATRGNPIEFNETVLLTGLFGGLFGAAVGALIADHRFPP
jgi:hypothetical protein